jgi:hypothetical protein
VPLNGGRARCRTRAARAIQIATAAWRSVPGALESASLALLAGRQGADGWGVSVSLQLSAVLARLGTASTSTPGRQCGRGAPMSTKSWGPLNGRHLTIMFVALIAGAVMVPATAWAVSVTKVVITDPGKVNRANVDAAGSLQTSAAPPASFYRNSHIVLGPTFVSVAKPPTGTALIVTSIHVDTIADPTPSTTARVGFDVMDANCNTPTAVVDDINPATLGVTVLPFEPGLAISSGKALCALEQGSVHAEVFVFGYTVPAGAVP